MNFKRTYSGKLTLTVLENNGDITIQISKSKPAIIRSQKRKWSWDRGTQIHMIKELMSTGPVLLQELYHFMSADNESKKASIRGSIYHNLEQFKKVNRGCWCLK